MKHFFALIFFHSKKNLSQSQVKRLYSNLPWYVCIIQVTTNVIYKKVSLIVAEISTIFKDNSNM